jgi:hypothetical protein
MIPVLTVQRSGHVFTREVIAVLEHLLEHTAAAVSGKDIRVAFAPM